VKKIYIDKNRHTDVCLLIGMWRANGNPNPNAHPCLSKEDFGAGLTPAPAPLGLRGL